MKVGASLFVVTSPEYLCQQTDIVGQAGPTDTVGQAGPMDTVGQAGPRGLKKAFAEKKREKVPVAKH